MPVIRFSTKKLLSLLGVELGLEELARLLERAKAEVEHADPEYVEVELDVDRPDMYTHEGMARTLRGLLGVERGLPSYEARDSGVVIEASEVPARPYIAGLVVWDLELEDEDVRELVELQERLHHSLGGGRRRVAIGLHDLDKMPSTRLRYVMEDVDKVRFVPLHHTRAMSLREVLEETEQGRLYGSISLQGSKHPVLYSGSEVIAVPPVINAELTRVEPGTRALFVDVTGTDERGVMDVVCVLAGAIAEKSRTRSIGLVRVVAPWGERVTPNTSPRRITVDIEELKSLVGVDLEAERIVELLRAMRLEAKLLDGGRLEVLAPFYRVDMLNWVDVAEELAIAVGYDKLVEKKPMRMLRGRLLRHRLWERRARVILAGYGFQEVYTYTLTSCRDQEALGGIEASRLVRIENPITQNMDCLRASLLPNLLRLAAENQHVIPLRVFELGEVITVGGSGDTGTETRLHLALLVMDRKVGYEDIQSYVYGLIRLLGDEVEEVREHRHPLLIEGRTAMIKTRRGVTGVLGEVHPSHLEKLGIEYPVAVAELDYTSQAEIGVVPRP